MPKEQDGWVFHHHERALSANNTAPQNRDRYKYTAIVETAGEYIAVLPRHLLTVYDQLQLQERLLIPS